VDKTKMKSMKLGPFFLTAVLLSGTFVFGQTTNLSFNGGYQGSNWNYGNETVGTGFYDGSINGVQAGLGQPGGLGMICDDFRDNVYGGETWTANAINASSLTSSNLGQTLFGSTIGVAGYQEVAYLVYQMFTTNPNAATQAAYSEAIWALTGSGVDASKLTGLALTLYNNVKAGGETLTASQLASLWIYTPSSRGPNEPQEMWGMVSVPEGGATLAYLFLAGCCCAGALFVRTKRQISGVRSA
jgi:hypothetical protein